jgi:hypothetical protein
MRPVALPLLLLLLAAGAIAASPRPAVVGYLPEWRFNAFSYNSTCQHLTHLIFFSVEPLPNGSLTGLDRLPGAEALASAYAGRRLFGTKLLLSLGGNGRSSGFSAAARDKATRKRLVAAGACVPKEQVLAPCGALTRVSQLWRFWHACSWMAWTTTGSTLASPLEAVI